MTPASQAWVSMKGSLGLQFVLESVFTLLHRLYHPAPLIWFVSQFSHRQSCQICSAFLFRKHHFPSWVKCIFNQNRFPHWIYASISFDYWRKAPHHINHLLRRLDRDSHFSSFLWQSFSSIYLFGSTDPSLYMVLRIVFSLCSRLHKIMLERVHVAFSQMIMIFIDYKPIFECIINFVPLGLGSTHLSCFVPSRRTLYAPSLLSQFGW